MTAPEVDEIGRTKGKSEGAPVEWRNHLPEGANIFPMGNEFKVELGRQ